jgi:alkaline phosphatase D
MTEQPEERRGGATRRTILEAAGAATATGAVATLFAGGAAGRATTPAGATDESAFEDPDASGSREVFPQSVASGGPTPEGVILWTRVAPDAVSDARPLHVEVAEDPDFEAVVFRGRQSLSADHDYTVRVDLDAKLNPDAFYHYRFVYDGTASPTGRCRTLPQPDADPDELRLAVATCNNFLQGHFGAYSHIADEDDVDYLVHLGDLIYESGGEGRHGRSIDLPSGHGQAWTLADFRTLHRTYRGDRDLQAALERHTLVHTWDDHEIVNNRWWNYGEDAPETASHPRGDDPEFMRRLHVEGIKALTEYVPFRAHYDPAADSLHEQFRLYRNLRFGRLADLYMTDERLFRTPPPEDELGGRDFATPPSRAQDDPDRWILGGEQRRWFLDGVIGSDATWKLWGNEVLNAALKVSNAGEEAFYVNYDAWDGYEHERLTLMGELHRHDVDNVVALTGDMHSYIAAYLKLDYKDAQQSEYHSDDGRVGVELMTPAVSSDNLADSGLFPPARQEEAFNEAAQSQNPHVEWINSNNYGYSVVELTDEAAVYTAYAVPRTPDGASAPKEVLRKFRVPEGEVELQEIQGGTVPDSDADGSSERPENGSASDSGSEPGATDDLA